MIGNSTRPRLAKSIFSASPRSCSMDRSSSASITFSCLRTSGGKYPETGDHCGVAMSVAAEASCGGDQAVYFDWRQILATASFGVWAFGRLVGGLIWRTFPKTMLCAVFFRSCWPGICGVPEQMTFPKKFFIGKVLSNKNTSASLAEISGFSKLKRERFVPSPIPVSPANPFTQIRQTPSA